jgi:DNA-binding transcriptional LysR family regulator
MHEMNFDWDDLRLFLAVARGGGLAAAQTETGKSPPTLGRRMLHLERRLGRDLFVREARGYTLTEDGQAFLRDVASLEAQLFPLLRTGADPARPLVKISAGTWVTEVLFQHTPQLLNHTQARLRFISAETTLDIRRRETLIGVRNRRPEDPALAGRKVGPVQFAAYARSPDVTRWARVLGPAPSARWVAETQDPQDMIEVTHPHNARDLAISGVACAVLPTFIGDREEMLIRVSPIIEDLTHDQWLVMHQDDRYLPEVRQVIDLIFDILKERCRSIDPSQ